MSRKRKSYKPSKSSISTNNTKSTADRLHNEQVEHAILQALYSSHNPLSKPEIFAPNSIKTIDTKPLENALRALEKNSFIQKTSKNRYKIPPSAPLYRGEVSQTAKGFGFVVATGITSSTPKQDRDLYISEKNLGGAMHGDTVLARPITGRKNRRTEGVVISILERRNNQLCGIISTRGTEIFVYPDDTRFPFKVQLVEQSELPVKDGDAVIVEYKRPRKMQRVLAGRLLSVLGEATDIDTQMEMVINSHDLPHLFSEEIEKEVAHFDDSFNETDGRLDLRALPHITIDGETAKDFDDAICVEKTKKGYRLYVSIADVSHFVLPGSAIDTEAFTRGTSVYFPGRVIPMLPEKLSNNLCSLVPDEDRYTVSAILDFDRAGNLIKKDFARSIIHSRKRFTYTTVRQIIVDKNPETRRNHKPFLTQLKWAGELATALRHHRFDRGSIDFNIAEPLFTLENNKKVANITRQERNFAHQLIEEFMLAANEAVASFFAEVKIEALYRTHEPPDESKLEEFLGFIYTLGLPIKPFESEPSWFAATVEACKGTRYEYIVNNLLLRSLKQAQYTAANIGHFGLAAPSYTHFTSPIRRYPDLIVHRLLLGLLEEKKPKQKKEKSFDRAGKFLSARERNAITAERDMNDRLKVAFMGDKIGEEFSAIISGITENSIFIEIDTMCIGGAIPVDLLVDDYYILDQKRYRLFGEITAKTYQIGDTIKVVLIDVDTIQKRLTFKVSGAGAE